MHLPQERLLQRGTLSGVLAQGSLWQTQHAAEAPPLKPSTACHPARWRQQSAFKSATKGPLAFSQNTKFRAGATVGNGWRTDKNSHTCRFQFWCGGLPAAMRTQPLCKPDGARTVAGGSGRRLSRAIVFQRVVCTGLFTGDSIASGTSDTWAPVSGSKSPSKDVVLPNSTENLEGEVPR